MPKIIIASGPVIVENGKVLLDLSGDDNFWKFCGGKVKENESLQETALRRAKEELGIDIKIIRDTPFIDYATKETDRKKYDVILVHWLAEMKGEINPGDDIRQWKWIPLKEIAKENLAPNIIPALNYFGFIEK